MLSNHVDQELLHRATTNVKQKQKQKKRKKTIYERFEISDWKKSQSVKILTISLFVFARAECFDRHRLLSTQVNHLFSIYINKFFESHDGSSTRDGDDQNNMHNKENDTEKIDSLLKTQIINYK